MQNQPEPLDQAPPPGDMPIVLANLLNIHEILTVVYNSKPSDVERVADAINFIEFLYNDLASQMQKETASEG